MPIFNPVIHQTSTLIVAASDSLYPERADYTCTGAADDVEINAAFARGAADTKVVLLEGTYTLADPIIFTHNNQVLEGQGRGTFIDGDGLATTEHAIVISALTNCTVSNLAIQTEDGGAKTCHCVFIEDGANDFTVEDVIVVDCDSDGIHIEGTTITAGHIHRCHIEDADDYGIHVTMTAANYMYRLNISDCVITGAGDDGIGLFTGGFVHYALVTNNVAYSNGGGGLYLREGEYSNVSNNIFSNNTSYGIRVRDSEHVAVTNNICEANVTGIMLEDSPDCIVEGNNCCDSGTYDGIEIDAGSIDCQVTGNHCDGNTRRGFLVAAAGSGVVGNIANSNGSEGFYISGADIKVNSNYAEGNGTSAAGTLHAIRLIAGGDRCQVNDNHCTDAGAITEDGIRLEDGATECQIDGNYIYNLMGSGIALVANSDNCQVTNNYVQECDDYGIEIAANTCDNALISGNTLQGNVTGQISDAGTDTQYGPNHTGPHDTAEAYIIDQKAATITVSASDSMSRGDYCCDGTADEVQINAALAALGAVGGKVQLLEGTYNIAATITMTAKTSLVGQGKGTILFLVAGSNCAVITGGAASHYIEISHLAVDGNGVNQGANTFLIILGLGGSSQYSQVHHCFVHDGRQNQGIIFNSGSHNICSNNIVKNCGIQMSNGYFVCSDNYIYNLPPTTGVDAALIVSGGHKATVSGNVVWVSSAGSNVGILISASTEVSVTGNTVYQAGTHGIELNNSQRCSVVGNNIDTACVDANHGGIQLNVTSVNNLIEGNFIKNCVVGIRVASIANSIIGNYIYDDGTARMQRGIIVSTGLVENQIRGNTIRLASLDGISINAGCHRSTVSGNSIFDCDAAGTTYSGIYIVSSDELNINDNHVDACGLHGIYLFRSNYCTLNGNICNNQTTGDGIIITGDGTTNSDYNTLIGNACRGNGDDGIAIEGVGDANKNIVVGNQLTGNTGTALVDNGTLTNVAHNITA